MGRRTRGSKVTGLLASAALVGITPTIAFSQTRDQNDKLLNTANGLLNRKLYKLAVPEYEKFLESSSNPEQVVTARYGLGVCYYRLQQYEDAAAMLEMPATTPTFEFAGDAELLRGHSFVLLGKYKEAGDRFAVLIERFPDHASLDDALSMLAESRYRTNDLDEAIAAATRLERDFPDSAKRSRAELFHSMALMAQHKESESLPHLEEVLKRENAGPIADQATFLRARALQAVNRPDDAIRAYRDAIARGVESFLPQAKLSLSQLLHDKGNLAEAETLAQEVIEQFGSSTAAPGAVFMRGRIHLDNDRFAPAKQDFERVLKTQEKALHDDAMYWIAKCEMRLDEPSRAADTLEKAIENYPDSSLKPEMMYDRAVALSRAGDVDGAIDAAGAYRRSFPEHRLVPEAMYLEASSELSREGYERAKSLASEYAGKFANHRLMADVIVVGAEADFLAGRWDDAIAGYAKLLNEFPNDDRGDTAHFRIGMAHHRQNRDDQAVQELARITRGASTKPEFRSALRALGDIAFARSEWPNAERHFKDYLEADPNAFGADDALLKLGLSRVRQNRPGEAIQCFDAIIAMDESVHTLQAMFERGQALIDMGNDEQAEKAMLAVVDADEGSRFAAFAMRHLGSIEQRKGNLEAATEWFARAAENGPIELATEAQLQQGEALLARGEFAQAAATLEPVTKTGGALGIRARISRSIALSRSGKSEAAVNEVDALLAMNDAQLDEPTRANLAYERAWSLRALKKSDESASALRTLLNDANIEPRLRAHALLDLASIQMDANQFEQALPTLNQLDELIRRDQTKIPESVREQAAYRRGVTGHKLEKFDIVANALDQFWKQYPQSKLMASAELLCGEALMRLNRHGDAIPHLQRLIKDHGEHENAAVAYIRLGEAQGETEQWSNSETSYTTFLKLYPDHEMWFKAQFGIGWAKEHQGQHEDAIKAYRRVVDGHEGLTAARAQFQIGECLFAIDKLDEAVTEFIRVDILHAYPEWSAAALYEAGRCFEKLNRFDQAREQYQSIVDRFGDTEWAQRAAQKVEQLRPRNVPGRG